MNEEYEYRLLDKDQVAEMLKVSTSTVDRLRKTADFPEPSMTFSYRPGQKILRWHADDIAEYMGMARQSATAELITVGHNIIDRLTRIASALETR